MRLLSGALGAHFCLIFSLSFLTSIFHRFVLDSIDSPQGGATAASPFVCRNVGGPPCLVGLHVQDCIAEGTWGNDIFNFGYDLASIFARAT